jgi:hypothetical protein
MDRNIEVRKDNHNFPSSSDSESQHRCWGSSAPDACANSATDLVHGEMCNRDDRIQADKGEGKELCNGEPHTLLKYYSLGTRNLVVYNLTADANTSATWRDMQSKFGDFEEARQGDARPAFLSPSAHFDHSDRSPVTRDSLLDPTG